ncbi:MAG: DUF3050 domain-containing protein [Sediminibacterium sp.]
MTILIMNNPSNHTLQLSGLLQEIEPLKKAITRHPVYSLLQEPADLQIFMKYHVYAVWDFMSLLKSLQNGLTCTTLPWFPKGVANTRFLINEIVVGEESDVDINGNRKSHFELYLDAMQQAGADTQPIHTFLEALKTGQNLSTAFQTSTTPLAAAEFVQYTFDVIQSGQLHLQSAIFTFGREDLIPNMFYALVNDLHQQQPEQISVFRYYLERHIEVDGDHHSQLAIAMTENLCGEDPEKWKEATAAVKQCLQKRLHLWDGVQQELQLKKTLPKELNETLALA